MLSDSPGRSIPESSTRSPRSRRFVPFLPRSPDIAAGEHGAGLNIASANYVPRLYRRPDPSGRELHPYIEEVARRVTKAGFIARAPDGLTSVGGYLSRTWCRRVFPWTLTAAGRRAAHPGAPLDPLCRVYPGASHGFHNVSTPGHDEAAVKLAWDRMIAWFARYLA